MSEIVNVVVAVAVIVFIFKWATSSSTPSNDPDNVAARALGFRPKKITDDEVDTITAMFPDIPRPNIHYDLIRTGNVERTSNKILERGFLDAPPPAYFTAYPSQPSAPLPVRLATASGSSKAKSQETLISRYHLQTRLSSDGSSSSPSPSTEINSGTSPAAADNHPEMLPGGKAKWEDSAEKREASLRERKAQMVLAARKRFEAQQAQAKA
ncbi:hypothetical protein BDV98DRAFT_576744 [Pterulicium gracile]|uniref:CUE domain-containing protein n=1 Tax=Pterulicium gracile TaxID=1884261 RepID=A0A5C3Q2M2_9AGAR|nr:hypothetical protein BDV98DRAFT_576744 [Pterula gracilis]